MNQPVFNLEAEVWLYFSPKEAGGAWHFVTLPQKESELIKELFSPIKRGFGSLPVNVTVGKTTWKTSLFTDKKAGAYLLPLKVEVRKKEQIKGGDRLRFRVEIRI